MGTRHGRDRHLARPLGAATILQGPYRLLVARARLLWRDNAHKFLSCAGCAIVLAGIITALA